MNGGDSEDFISSGIESASTSTRLLKLATLRPPTKKNKVAAADEVAVANMKAQMGEE